MQYCLKLFKIIKTLVRHKCLLKQTRRLKNDND